MTTQTETQPIQGLEDGAVFDAPLNRLKKSPRNARRTPHSEAAVEAMAASIAAKRVLQAPVVEPEADEAAYPGLWAAVGVPSPPQRAWRRRRLKLE